MAKTEMDLLGKRRLRRRLRWENRNNWKIISPKLHSWKLPFCVSCERNPNSERFISIDSQVCSCLPGHTGDQSLTIKNRPKI